MRVDLARMQAVPPPQPPSTTHSASSALVSSPASPESLETVQREGRQTQGQEQKGEASAGTGEGGDKGGQAVASGEGAEVAAARPGRKGEERGEHAAARPWAEPFNLAESNRLGGSVLVVSEDGEEEARMMAVKGGQRQRTAPKMPTAPMTSILPEVQRKEKCKGSEDEQEARQGAGATEGGDSRVRTGGREQTGKGGKQQVGASGTRQEARHQEGKGGKGGGQGRQWQQPQQSFRQLPPGSTAQVSPAVRAEEERKARRQQTARYEALAHMERQRGRCQPPKREPNTIYRLDMGSERGRSARQGEQEGTGGGHSSQPSGRPQGGEGQAGQSSQAVAGRHGQRGGRQESGRQQSRQTRAVEDRGTGREESSKNSHGEQGERGIGEGLQGRGQGKAGHQGTDSKGQGKAGQAGKEQGKVDGDGYKGSPVFPGKGLGGWWGCVVPTALPPFAPPPYPAVGMVHPSPPAYPGLPPPAAMQQHPQASRAAWGAQGGKEEAHRRAWERKGEEERGLEEREGRIIGGAARVAEGWTTGQGTPRGGGAQAVEELQRAWANLRRRLERVERAEREGERHREQAQESGGSEGCPPLQPFRQLTIPPEMEREIQERAWRQIRGEAARLAERDKEAAAQE